ncbi:hypothetical protein [Egicoccus sp. AB-alg2]|uniref:hypothetical protein n=1 Tax=Egicoccus sp. AB-alg2 TaxID=3242693 RepID=UPI00359DA735
MHIELTIDTDDAAEIARAIALLEHIANTASPATSPLASRTAGPGEAGPELADILRVVAGPGYGQNRLDYLRLVAAAGDEGVSIAELRDTHFGRSPQRYGGTHSSIEKGWRSNGGLRFARQLIDDTPDGRQVMYGPARQHILEQLG